MALIHGGRLIDPQSGTDEPLDILLEGGRIARIGKRLPRAGCDCIDAAGLVVAPGLIDTHVHFREPGATHKERIATGAAAAARGGFTTVVCMANTTPPMDSPALLAANLARGRQTGIRVLQAACVTQGLQGQHLADLPALAAAGAACFTDDGLPIASSALARAGMEQAHALGKVISFHEEDAALLRGSGVNEGAVSRALGVAGACAAAEDTLVARDCMLALHTGARIVIQHISSAAAVAMVRLAKNLGADVHAEATPHHFSLTEQAVLLHGTLARMNPPLRTEADRLAILEGLRDGTIDIIATDHAPHTAQEKAQPLAEAPSGIIGLETALALGITNLVRTGCLTLPGLLAKLTANPAACYRLEGGALRPGAPADLVLFDPDEPWTVAEFASQSCNSPFVGARLTGRVHRTICAGKTVYTAF